ncbi:UNVERIFIED_CONTAM: hypothetical protein Sindi_0159800, partial [Sesamum indicum]
MPPISFWCDKKVALYITTNPVFHKRTRYLDIDYHLVPDQFKHGFIAPTHNHGPDQPTNIFTKALLVPAFDRLPSKLSLSSQAPS